MWQKIKSFLTVVSSDFADTWKRTKIFIFAIGGLIVYLEFNKIKDALLAYGAKKEIDTTQKKDDKVAIQEDANNKQADALVAKAKEEPNPGDDWNK
jgi:hypothetical protein